MLLAMFYLIILITALTPGWVNWRVLDREAQLMSEAVFIGQGVLEKMMAQGLDAGSEEVLGVFQVEKSKTPFSNLQLLQVRVNWESGEENRYIKLETLFNPDCLLRGSLES